MKKILLLTASAVLLLASCQKSEVVVGENDQQAISFSAYNSRNVTKADPSPLTGGNINVAAYYRENSSAAISAQTGYFESQLFSYSGGSFNSSPVHYWPSSGVLDFYASMPTTITAGKTVEFTADGSVDFMAAKLEGESKPESSSPTLPFGHKLTQVKFAFKGGIGGLKYKVTSLTLTANKTATYTWTSDEWTAAATTNDYSVISSTPMEFTESATPAAHDVSTVEYCIPNQPSDENTVKINVKYQVYDGTTLICDKSASGVDIDVTETASGSGDDNKWGINHSVKYLLTLNISSHPIEFNASLDEWNDKDDIFLPGEFSVSATKKVKFTKGNLYWNGEAWAIEANQTDYQTSWDPNHVSHLYWALNEATSYAESNNEDTATSGTPWFAESSSELVIGGNSDIYAPSFYELEYMFKTRANASSKYKLNVSVDGTPCTVVAPDSFSGTLSDSYTLDQANEAGLLCLPILGQRTGQTISSVGENAIYVTSSEATTGTSNYASIFMSTTTLTTRGYGNSPKGAGRSNASFVRLVQTIE